MITKREINRDSSRFFIKESDDTPHPGSKRHPEINSQFMYNFHRLCNKLFEIMTPFNGDKIRPRLAVKAGDKTFSWLFDTGAAVTCMNKQSFELAFGHSKPKQISKPQSCVAASGDKMSSYGVFEIDLFIKGKKFTHPVNVIEELNENIIGIDFIHAHKLTYDVISCKVMFAGAGTNSIMALKNTVLPAMMSTVI